MTNPGDEVDSRSVGDPALFLSAGQLEQGLSLLPPPPKDEGRVVMIMRRTGGGRREILDSARLLPGVGIQGDDPASGGEEQLAVIWHDAASLIANGQPLQLFGDNLFIQLDLSAGSLPPGSVVQAGEALLQVTASPHDGCRKFGARFGPGGLRIVSDKRLRHLNLRGIYMKVLQEGSVKPGDPILVKSRPGA